MLKLFRASSYKQNIYPDDICLFDMKSLPDYREHLSKDIESKLAESNVQPVLFVGSGISIRYFGGPSWHELLKSLHEDLPDTEYPYGYYRQRHDAKTIGEILSEKYYKWAWTEGQSEFPNELLDPSNTPEIFIKNKVSDTLSGLTPEGLSAISETELDDLTVEDAREELETLKSIQPHAIITTNYDKFLENIFNEDFSGDSGYEVVVGEEVLQNQHKNIGEIYKIHGCISEPESIILTKSDYKDFNNRQRYLSSKLLTYLIEHPVLIIGYSANDPNIQQIFSWVQTVLSDEKRHVDDIYYVTYDKDIKDRKTLPTEKQIRTDNGKQITVNQVAAKNFGWIFEAFSSSTGLEIPIGQARDIVNKTYNLVSTHAPESKVVDQRRLEEISESEEELAKVLGIAVEEVPPIEFEHNLRAIDVAEELGYEHWMPVNQLIDELAEEEGVNIKEFNNRYHIAFFDDERVEPRRYSEDTVELLRAFREGDEYELGIPEERIPNSNDNPDD